MVLSSMHEKQAEIAAYLVSIARLLWLAFFLTDSVF